jgi:t-SNARE complex subunit (syntaxin)
MRDRMLVETYLSVKEIERLRDQRIELVEAQVRIDEQNLGALKEREQRLLRQATRYLPYKAKATPLPEHVVEEMVTMVNSRNVTEQRITAKQTESQELKTKFASDIRRFKELKGL